MLNTLRFRGGKRKASWRRGPGRAQRKDRKRCGPEQQREVRGMCHLAEAVLFFFFFASSDGFPVNIVSAQQIHVDLRH